LLFIALGFALALLFIVVLPALLRRLGNRPPDGQVSLDSLARQASKELRQLIRALRLTRGDDGAQYAFYRAAVTIYDEAYTLLAYKLDPDYCRVLFNRFISACKGHGELLDELRKPYKQTEVKARRRHEWVALLDWRAERLLRAEVPSPLAYLLRELRRCLELWTAAEESATEERESLLHKAWLLLYDEVEGAVALARNPAVVSKQVEKLIMISRERAAFDELLVACMASYKCPALIPREVNELLEMQVGALLRVVLLAGKVPTLDEAKPQFLANLADVLLPLPAEHGGRKILQVIEPEVRPLKRRRRVPAQAAAL
jgi:hypothetical protein